MQSLRFYTAAALALNMIVIAQSSPLSYKPTGFNMMSPFARNIQPINCTSGPSGEQGVCMFALDCRRINGKHLGTCMDRFYFGSCCSLDSVSTGSGNNPLDNSLLTTTQRPATSSSTTISSSSSSSSQVTELNVNSIDVTVDNVAGGYTTPVTSPKPSTTIATESTTAELTPSSAVSTAAAPSSSTVETVETTTGNPTTVDTSPTASTVSTQNPTTAAPSLTPTVEVEEDEVEVEEEELEVEMTTEASEESVTDADNVVESSEPSVTEEYAVEEVTTDGYEEYTESPYSTEWVDQVSTEETTVETTSAPTLTEPVISSTENGSTSSAEPTSSTTSQPTTVQVIPNESTASGATTEAESSTSSSPTSASTTRPETSPQPTSEPFVPSQSSTSVPTTEQSIPDASSTSIPTSSVVEVAPLAPTTDQVVDSTPSSLDATSTPSSSSSTSNSSFSSSTPTSAPTTVVQNVNSTSPSETTPLPLEPTTSASDNTTSLGNNGETHQYQDYLKLCGRPQYEYPTARIVGGTTTQFGQWPWQVSLRQYKKATFLHKCGAALLNENWAITAAHCVENVKADDLLLRLGEYDLATDEEEYPYVERRVQIVVSHPQFDARTFEHDLALLRFYDPVRFQPNIIPICLAEEKSEFVGKSAFVTGWGRLYEGGPLPPKMQQVSVPIINNTECEGMYRRAGYVEHIPDIFICAGYTEGKQDSCEGDSGGPMVIRQDDSWVLGGVISWGIGCAEANQPGVYTRISEFREWIDKIIVW